jgi:hypothetical protein
MNTGKRVVLTIFSLGFLIVQRRNDEPVTSIEYIRAGSAGPRVTIKPGEQNVELVVPVP